MSPFIEVIKRKYIKGSLKLEVIEGYLMEKYITKEEYDYITDYDTEQ